MKKLLITTMLIVAFGAVKGQEDKLYLGKNKSEVMALLTLDDEITDVNSGIADDSTFFYSSQLDDNGVLAYYFGDGSSCTMVAFFCDFNTYKKQLKEFTRKSKNADSNIEALIDPSAFLLKDSQYVCRFLIEEDTYQMLWFDMGND